MGDELTLDAADERLLSDLLASPDRNAYEVIGADVVKRGLGAGSRDAGDDGDVGEHWFEQHLQEVRDAVCDHPNVVGLRVTLETDAARDAVVIAGTLLSLLGVPGALAAAVIVLRRGLNKFCG